MKLFGNNSSFSDFADRKQLAADGNRFCMEDAKIVTQKDGKQRWYCTIYVDQGNDESVVKTLTFDRSPSRDAGFQEANDEQAFPLHNCWLEKREFKGKNSGLMQTFYQIRQDEKSVTCPCGGLGGQRVEENETPDLDSSPDLSDVPF